MPLKSFLSELVDVSDCEIVPDNARVPDAAVIRRASLSSSMRSSTTIYEDDDQAALASSMRSYLLNDDEDRSGYLSHCSLPSGEFEESKKDASTKKKKKDSGIEMIDAIQKLSIRAAMENTRPRRVAVKR